jgi:ATP/ADP translocase
LTFFVFAGKITAMDSVESMVLLYVFVSSIVGRVGFFVSSVMMFCTSAVFFLAARMGKS